LGRRFQQPQQQRVHALASLFVVASLIAHVGEDSMAKASEKPRELRPYDLRPWPKSGDRNIDKTYAAIGRALSNWERYEWILSHLFSAIVAGVENNPARRAYGAVRTFEGRSQMLRAASVTYFSERPDTNLQGSFKKIITSASKFSERRNEIAHGVWK
jgi:hypothetical protein